MKKQNGPGDSNLIHLGDVRSKRADQERRQVERFFLRDILQFFCVLDQGSLYPIELIEASETGCSFRVPYGTEEIPRNQDLTIRVYLSKDTFLVLGARINNSVPMTDQGKKYVRHGCSFDRGFASYTAYQDLLKFIESYSKAAVRETRKASGA